MLTLKFGKSHISEDRSPYFIAEIGHNHQGNLETALEMITVAASCGANAVKFQKRDNKTLFTKAQYNKPYENENSYGATYGEHREFLEFGKKEFKKLKQCAEENGVEFMCTAFDIPSVDFLEDIGISSYKIASGDLTNLPLLTYVAKKNKPIFVSTGATTLKEVRMAYEAILKHNKKLCLLHCSAGYPTDYPDLNLQVIETLKKEFPDVIIGYSGHDDGLLAPVIAYMLGAKVIEKHFTLSHSWKGTDHSFSLEPEGLRKQIVNLKRVDLALGDNKKIIRDFEKNARLKMGKSIYTKKSLPTGTVLTGKNMCIKSPGGGLPPYYWNELIGKKLKTSLEEEMLIRMEDIA